jgi:tape measure domain-containing protein
MTTEKIDIRIREDGSVAVKRNIDSIGQAATKTEGAVSFLKRTLATLGVGLGVREILQLADSYTSLQNRLRSTGLEGNSLTAVYQSLLKASNDTRSSVEGSVELYSRLALSSKELGVSQQQLIDFTTSLNQAITLSGATAVEAKAGLIQLSQGMASGTLRGDELRSVMEQLPAVADVIAKKLGVTRGELRKLGEDGKISAGTIISAFKDAREELAERFGKTVPTMSQSFEVLRNNVLDFVGKLDSTLGVSTAISKSLLFLAQNLETVAKLIATVTAGFVLFGGSALIVRGVSAAVVTLNAAIAANPIGALLIVLTSVITGLVLFRDQISLGIDAVTSFGDLLRAIGVYAGEAFDGLVGVAGTVFNSILGFVDSAFNTASGVIETAVGDWLTYFKDFYTGVGTGLGGVLKFIARTFDAIGGLVIGFVYGAVTALEGLPGAASIPFRKFYNVAVTEVERLVNATIDGVNKIRSFLGKDLIDNVKFARVEVNDEYFKQYGAAIMQSVKNGFDSQGGALEKTLDGLFAKAKEFGLARNEVERLAKRFPNAPSTAAGPAAKPPVDAKEYEKAENALRSLLNTIIPSIGAEYELAKAQRTLNDAQRLGIITGEQNAKYLAIAKRYYQDIIDPVAAYTRELNEQADILQVTSRERGVESELLRFKNDLMRKGIDLSEEDIDVKRKELRALRDLTEAVQAQDQLLANSVEKRREFGTQLAAINKLLSDPTSGFTAADANTATVNLAPDLFAGTKQSVEAALEIYREGYRQIQELQDAKRVDEATADQMRLQQATLFGQQLIQLELKAAQMRLDLGSGDWVDAQLVSIGRLTEGFTTFMSGTSAAFGDFFTSLADGFADSVGRSIVYADSLGEALSNVARQAIASLISALVKLGIQWVVNAALGQSIAATSAATSLAITTTTAAASAAAWAPAAALASLASFGANSAPAAAALIGTVTLAESLAALGGIGLKEGGYTGNVSRDQVTGAHHGQEFVVNADATSRHRRLLETINAGANVGPALLASMPSLSTAMPAAAPAAAPLAAPIAAGASYSAPAPIAAPAGPAPAPQLNARIVNLVDPALFGDYLETSAGEEMVLNVLRKNSDSVRAIAAET